MKKTTIILLFLLLCNFVLIAQTKMSGVVYDEYLEPFPAATIKINSKKIATSNFDGTFTINIKQKLPVIIEVSSSGYSKETLKITSSNDELYFVLKETGALEQVVVSASRTPERILESPVTVERIGLNDIKKNASFNFYDGLENLKAVDINTSSLGFKSINTRGFAGFENARFVQLIDGMDNMIPSLNFTMGNMAGSPDIDIESVEILPGAASALYGANAFNGILLMNTKNPFYHRGITVQLGSGVTSQKLAGQNPLYDASVRLAHAFSDKFAVKGTFSYYKGEEWHAGDTRNIVNGLISKGTRETNPSYNGVNVYGDETTVLFADLTKENEKYENEFYDNAIKHFSTPEKANDFLFNLGNNLISRTGYIENSLVSNKTKRLNFNGALHFRPFSNDKLELIWNSKINKWDNIYQGSSRLAQKDFNTQLHKLEIKGHDFFARAYYSQNDAGNSYDILRTARYINNTWKSGNKYNNDYLNEFINRYNFPNNNVKEALELARLKVDTDRYTSNSNSFNNAFNKITSDVNPKTGSKQQDLTSFYHGDVQFNLQNYIDWVEVIVGLSYRSYKLKSFGTIFNDKGGHIRYDEYGTYLQLQKSLLDKRLRLTGSIRYDKTTNYDGNYSPRLALTYAAGKNRGHNIRVSYQTAFRNPTAQEQYIGLQVSPHNYILGSTENNIKNYIKKYTNKEGTERVITGKDIYNRGFTPLSVKKYLESSSVNGSRNLSLLEVGKYDFVKPEQLKTLEVGYRGLLNINETVLNIDFNTYYNTYNDLITEKELWVGDFSEDQLDEEFDLRGGKDNLTAEQIKNIRLKASVTGIESLNDYESYRVKTNSKATMNSWGTAIALNTKIFKNFDIGANYSYTDFKYNKKEDPDFTPNFNTSKHKVKFQFGNRNLFKNFGFNIQTRWQDKYYWQSPFVSGLIPARTLVDAQVNYRIPSLKSTFKLGGTNLLGKEYFSAPGTGATGSLYYLTWIIND